MIELTKDEREILAAIASIKSTNFGWKPMKAVADNAPDVDFRHMDLEFWSLVDNGFIEYIEDGTGNYDGTEAVRLTKKGRAAL